MSTPEKSSNAAELLPEVYEELRRLASIKLATEKPGQTLQPTALVHEAWLKLQGREGNCYNNPRHFFAAAANAMRQILIDRARKRNTAKHGAHVEMVRFDFIDVASNTEDGTLLALNAAREKLQVEDPIKAELVNLRFFVGMTVADAGKLLDLSESTVKRHWNYARAFLIAELRRQI